jgi:cutinase
MSILSLCQVTIETSMISPLVAITAFLAITANAAPTELIVRQLDGGCKRITFLFARCSTEIRASSGYMGQTVGPAFRKPLQTKFGANEVNAQVWNYHSGEIEDRIADWSCVKGINYPADIMRAISGGASPTSSAGSKNMATLAKDTINRCADKTSVVLSGYSQGAEQVHGALQFWGHLEPKFLYV